MGCKQSKAAAIKVRSTLPSNETTRISPTTTETFRPQIDRALFKHGTDDDWMYRLSQETIRLYKLIRNEDNDAAIDWLNPNKNGGNDQLLQLIGSYDYSPLMAIIDAEEHHGRVSDSALQLCDRLIEIGGKDLLQRCTHHGTVLHHSCYSQSPCQILIRKLIDSGGKELVLMANRSEKHTILHEVCRDLSSELFIDDDENLPFRSTEKLVNVLLDVGGKELAFLTNRWSRTALDLVIEKNKDYDDQRKLNVVKMLLKVGGEELAFMKDKCGYTALHYSCFKTDENIPVMNTHVIRHLLEVGGERLALIGDDSGRTPLHHAFLFGFGYELLLEFGGAKFALMVDIEGNTALHLKPNISHKEEVVTSRNAAMCGKKLS